MQGEGFGFLAFSVIIIFLLFFSFSSSLLSCFPFFLPSCSYPYLLPFLFASKLLPFLLGGGQRVAWLRRGGASEESRVREKGGPSVPLAEVVV